MAPHTSLTCIPLSSTNSRCFADEFPAISAPCWPQKIPFFFICLECFYSGFVGCGKRGRNHDHNVFSVCGHVFSAIRFLLEERPLALWLRTGTLTLVILPLNSCVTLGESLNLSRSLFPLLLVLSVIIVPTSNCVSCWI